MKPKLKPQVENLDYTSLFEFKEICDKLDIEFFLVFGTCLTIYRDGNTEKFGDNGKIIDLDIGVKTSRDNLIKLFDALMKNGFKAGPYFKNPGWELNHHFYKYGILLDVWFQFTEDIEPFIKEFDVVEFKGKEFKVPKPVEKYLELEYGRKWKIPCNEYARPIKPWRAEKMGWVSSVDYLSLEEWLKFCDTKGRFTGLYNEKING